MLNVGVEAQQGATGSEALLLADSASPSPLPPLSTTPSSALAADGGAMIELKAVLSLFAGIALARGSWVFIKTTDTALIGHVDTQALSSSALADLWMSSTGVLVLGRVLGVFVGQAVGASNPRMAIVWLQVSLAVLLPGMLVVMALWVATGPVLSVIGAEEELLPQASYYAKTLALALPGRTLIAQVSQFLSAHGLVKPEAQASLAASLVNLTLGLVLVLGVPIRGWSGFGFDACPWVTTFTETAQILGMMLVFGRWQRLHERLGWEGILWNEVTRARVFEFLRMYVPAALSTASDFWRMSCIGLFVESYLGSAELATFNASYRILWMVLVVVGALASAMRIRLSIHLGAGDMQAGKLATRLGVLLAGSSLTVLAISVAVYARAIARIFSDDEILLDLFHSVRLPLALALFLMNLTVFLEQIPIAMGRTRVTFFLGVIGSWLGQVPCTFLALKYWRQDLFGLYVGVAAGYLLVSVLLFAYIVRVDWAEVIREAQERSEIKIRDGGAGESHGSQDEFQLLSAGVSTTGDDLL